MNLKCPRVALANALTTLSPVVPTRTPKEILKNVKLILQPGEAILIATDEEVGIRVQFPVESQSSGEVLLPIQKLLAILREASGDSVSLEAVEGRLTVKAGRSEFKLTTPDPAEFPDVAPFSEESYFVIPGKHFKMGIQRTVFAADVESTRYALGGVLLECRGDTLHFAATDSRRLAIYKTKLSRHGQETEPAQSVVPSKAMTLIEKSIPNDDQDLHLAVFRNHILVRTGSSTIYSRLVEGRFPRYQDVVPTRIEKTIQLVAGPFHSAVKQAMIVTNDESRGVDFDFEAGELTMRSHASDVGTSQVEIPVSYDGEWVGVTFDPRFVADFLKVLDPSSPVTLQLIDANSASVFRADEDYTYVVMPLSREDKKAAT